MGKASFEVFRDVLWGGASILTLKGAGIASAVRRFSLWVPILIVLVGSIRLWMLGALWLFQVWILFAVIARLMLKAFANDRRERGDFVSILKLTGWCLIPIMIFMLLIGPDDVLDNLLIHMIPSLWAVFAFGVGWSALSGMGKVASIIAGMIALSVVGIIQMAWVFLFLIAIYGL